MSYERPEPRIFACSQSEELATKIAKSLLQQFGSVNKILTADEEKLKMADIDLVFGFKYKNETAYNIYVNAYKTFNFLFEN